MSSGRFRCKSAAISISCKPTGRTSWRASKLVNTRIHFNLAAKISATSSTLTCSPSAFAAPVSITMQKGQPTASVPEPKNFNRMKSRAGRSRLPITPFPARCSPRRSSTSRNAPSWAWARYRNDRSSLTTRLPSARWSISR